MMAIIRGEQEVANPSKRKKVPDMAWWVGEVKSMITSEQGEANIEVQWYGKPKTVTGSYFPGWKDTKGNIKYNT